MPSFPVQPAGVCWGFPAGTRWMTVTSSVRYGAMRMAFVTRSCAVTISDRTNVTLILRCGERPVNMPKKRWRKQFCWIIASSCTRPAVKKEKVHPCNFLKAPIGAFSIYLLSGYLRSTVVVQHSRMSLHNSDFFARDIRLLLTSFVVFVNLK